MADIIFWTRNLRRVYPPDRIILEDISLSFFSGAKIGVLGANGSGKSTLLRIMAGVDPDFSGEARAADGTRIGYLPQEPELDLTKTVREVVEEGVSELRSLLQRFEEISMKFSESLSEDEMERLLNEQAGVQDEIEAAGAWEIDRTVDIAMDALRVPDGESCCSMSRPITSTPNR